MSEKLEISNMKGLILQREKNSHKGSFGRVLIIAGSKNYPGAAALSTLGALRSGAGLTELMTSEEVINKIFPLIPEAIINTYKKNPSKKALKEALKRASAVVFGSGMGNTKRTYKLLKFLITKYSGTLIIDADGINALSKNIDILYKKKCNIILTPHPGEMARLGRTTTENIAVSREGIASVFAKNYNVTVVLKGNGTVVAGESGVFVNTTGSPAMAKGGSGDVLSGMIGSLKAAGATIENAAKLGVFIHGLAGDLAAAVRGEHATLPRDIIDYIPEAIKTITE
jgi:NAD(P)H-hydrate epimerase